MKRLTRPQALAKRTLRENHKRLSWAAVSRQCGGLNRGLLCAIASGKRRVSERVLTAMNIPLRIAPSKPRKPRIEIAPESLAWLRAEAEWRELAGPGAVVDRIIEREMAR